MNLQVLLHHLRVLWTARRSNQSILKEIGPGCSLEGMMLKLKLQHSGHHMRSVDSLEKTLMLGGIRGRRRRGRQRMRWLLLTWQTWVWVNSGSCWWSGKPGVLQFMRSQRVGHDWATELTNWLHHYFLWENVLNVWPTHSFLMYYIRCKHVSFDKAAHKFNSWKYKLFLRILILISHLIFSLSSCFVLLHFCLYQLTF